MDRIVCRVRSYEATREERKKGLSQAELLEMSLRVKAGSWEFTGSRRKQIPKPNKPGEFRPLTIPDMRDKVVHRALLGELERIFDPKFHETSHGFRKTRGCHSCLAEVSSWRGVSRLMDYDVEKCFDRMDRSLLMSLIAEEVKEEPVLRLIEQQINSPIFPSSEDSGKGIAQGIPLSPLYMNIYLHELDTMIMSELRSRNRGEGYVRYADNILLSGIGLKREAVSLMVKVKKWLRSNRRLNLKGRSNWKTLFLGCKLELVKGKVTLKTPRIRLSKKLKACQMRNPLKKYFRRPELGMDRICSSIESLTTYYGVCRDWLRTARIGRRRTSTSTKKLLVESKGKVVPPRKKGVSGKKWPFTGAEFRQVLKYLKLDCLMSRVRMLNRQWVEGRLGSLRPVSENSLVPT